MAVDLDVSKLEQELQGIYNERQVVNERIRTYIPGRGLGRGRGPPGGPGDPLRGAPLPGRGGPGRGPGPGHYSGPQDFRGGAPGPRGRDLPPSFANRISDRPPRDNSYAGRPGRDQPQSSVRDRLGPRLSSAISQDFQRAQPEAPLGIPDNAESAGSRKRLLSAVVVGGQTLQPLQQDEDLVATKRPRPDDSEDNPAAKKRNRRMFGFLNQTLQKCKDDSSDFRKSKVAQQRDEALKRAEERRRGDLIKFKADFKREMASKRQSEVNKKRELNMQAEVKRAEIAYVQKVLHRSKVANFIQTTASPALCWLPGKPNAATQALLQQEQAKLDVYKQDEAAKVEAKKQQITAAVASMAAALEAADARRREAALNPPRPAAAAPATAAAAEGAASGEGAATDADAATPMQTDEAANAEQNEEADADDLEDGAYVVLDEEDEEGSPEHEQAKPADRASNGGNAEPMSTEDDRYVATAYDADEEQNRSDDPADHASGTAAAAPVAESSPQVATDNPSERAAGPDSSLADAEIINSDTAMPAADDSNGQAPLERDLEASDAAQLIAEAKATSAEPMQT